MTSKKRKPAKRIHTRAHMTTKGRPPLVLWRWMIIVIPLVVGIIWIITLLISYNNLPILYEEASPSSILSLLGLIFIFVISYGAFVFMELKRNISEL